MGYLSSKANHPFVMQGWFSIAVTHRHQLVPMGGSAKVIAADRPADFPIAISYRCEVIKLNIPHSSPGIGFWEIFANLGDGLMLYCDHATLSTRAERQKFNVIVSPQSQEG